YDPVFVPDAGVTSRLALSGATTMTRDSTGEFFGALASGHVPFNPADSLFEAGYPLTTRDGLAYNIDPPTGHSQSVTDATGNTVQLAYDPTHTMETITDALGNKTTLEYDDRGNTVRQIDGLGAVTRRTFDADSNMLTETDPLGRTSTFTYNNLGDVLTQ